METNSRYGFQQGILADLEIFNDIVVERDITMIELETVSVSGRVVSSANLEDSIAGAVVSLGDYEEEITDAEGEFVFSDVFVGQDYLLTIRAENHQIYENIIQVEGIDIDLGELIINEIALKPGNVLLQEQGDDMLISWGEPGSGTLTEFRYDNGTNNGQLGLNYGTTYGVLGSVFRASAEIYEVSWFTTDAVSERESVNVFIFALNSNGMPTDNILYQALNVPNTDMQWSNHILTEPVTVRDGFMLALSYTGFLSLGFDTGTDPEWQFQENTHFFNPQYETQAWETVESAGEAYRKNFMLRAYGLKRDEFDYISRNNQVDFHNARRITSDVLRFKESASFNTGSPSYALELYLSRDNLSRGLEGYLINRFLIENQYNEAEWCIVGAVDNAQTYQFLDEDWSEVTPGVYRYAVRSIYSNNVYSQAVFSEILEYDMYMPVTLTVSTNTESNPAGAVISMLNNERGFVYDIVVPASGIVQFENVWRGFYTVKVALNDFDTYLEDEVHIYYEPFNYTIELQESLLPVVNLDYSIQNENNVHLSWLEPGTVFGTERWLHYNIGANVDAVGTNGVAEFAVAVRFSPMQLQELDVVGLYLDKIRFFPYQNGADYTLKVWQGGSGNPLNPGEEILSQAVINYQYEAWNEIILDTPVYISGDRELWIGYDIITPAGYPAGIDAGPAFNNYGNLMYFNGTWTTLSILVPALDRNWSLQGFARRLDDTGEVLLSQTRNKIRNNQNNRLFLGYKVMRNDEVLNEYDFSLSYTDISVPNGSYVYSVSAQYSSGEAFPVLTEEITILSDKQDFVSIPIRTELLGNYPNPFNPNTKINFSLDKNSFVRIKIYNIKGQVVRSLMEDNLKEGYHSVIWNGEDNNGKEAASGLYFYKMESDDYSAIKKTILIK